MDNVLSTAVSFMSRNGCGIIIWINSYYFSPISTKPVGLKIKLGYLLV